MAGKKCFTPELKTRSALITPHNPLFTRSRDDDYSSQMMCAGLIRVARSAGIRLAIRPITSTADPAPREAALSLGSTPKRRLAINRLATNAIDKPTRVPAIRMPAPPRNCSPRTRRGATPGVWCHGASSEMCGLEVRTDLDDRLVLPNRRALIGKGLRYKKRGPANSGGSPFQTTATDAPSVPVLPALSMRAALIGPAAGTSARADTPPAHSLSAGIRRPAVNRAALVTDSLQDDQTPIADSTTSPMPAINRSAAFLISTF